MFAVDHICNKCLSNLYSTNHNFNTYKKKKHCSTNTKMLLKQYIALNIWLRTKFVTIKTLEQFANVKNIILMY